MYCSSLVVDLKSTRSAAVKSRVASKANRTVKRERQKAMEKLKMPPEIPRNSPGFLHRWVYFSAPPKHRNSQKMARMTGLDMVYHPRKDGLQLWKML
ncbi:hypothetical protein SCA6_002815 [Theobroma cacao]